ncbi:MAG: hypothetical protein ACUVQ4_07460 [bacterium]
MFWIKGTNGKKKKSELRQKERRRLLTEEEFRVLIEKGKLSKNDRRKWLERCKSKRRKKQIGV